MRVGLLLAALAVVMLAFAGAAEAKKKKKKLGPVVSATATAAGSVSGQIFTATATCPKGTNAVGGGFSTPPLPPSPNQAAIAIASHKVGSTQWLASMQYIGTSGPSLGLTTVVNCRKGAPATAPVSTSTSLPIVGGSAPIPTTPSNASCSAKKVQLSGGFTLDRAIDPTISIKALPLSSNRSAPLTWQATGIAIEGGHTLTSQADCAKQPKAKKGKKKKKLKAPTEVTGDTQGSNSSSAATVTAIATCPGGTVPVNGGFSQPGALSTNSSGFFFLSESQAVGNTWHVSGFNLSGPGSTATLRAHGYCAK